MTNKLMRFLGTNLYSDFVRHPFGIFEKIEIRFYDTGEQYQSIYCILFFKNSQDFGIVDLGGHKYCVEIIDGGHNIKLNWIGGRRMV